MKKRVSMLAAVLCAVMMVGQPVCHGLRRGR